MNILHETKSVFKKTGFHFRTGVAYMLPVLLIGGVLGSIAIIGKGSDAQIWKTLAEVGQIGLKYFVPFMSAFVAYSIADNAGIAPGFIVGILAQQTDSGYLGALMSALLVGFLTYMLLKINFPEILSSTWGMVAPVISTFIVSIFLVFIIAPPIAYIMNVLSSFLHSLGKDGGAVMGSIMGILGGIDYGGPFSKTQSTFATAVLGMNIFTPLGVCGAIVTVPPIGMCLATFISPRLYSKKEKTYAKQSWIYALVAGFTEIVIPLAIGDIFRVTIATVSGCMITGLIAGIFQLELMTPILGIPQWFFYNSILVYAVSVICGILTVALVANLLKSMGKRNIEAIDREDATLN